MQIVGVAGIPRSKGEVCNITLGVVSYSMGDFGLSPLHNPHRVVNEAIIILQQRGENTYCSSTQFTQSTIHDDSNKKLLHLQSYHHAYNQTFSLYSRTVGSTTSFLFFASFASLTILSRSFNAASCVSCSIVFSVTSFISSPFSVFYTSPRMICKTGCTVASVYVHYTPSTQLPCFHSLAHSAIRCSTRSENQIPTCFDPSSCCSRTPSRPPFRDGSIFPSRVPYPET